MVKHACESCGESFQYEDLLAQDVLLHNLLKHDINCENFSIPFLDLCLKCQRKEERKLSEGNIRNEKSNMKTYRTICSVISVLILISAISYAFLLLKKPTWETVEPELRHMCSSMEITTGNPDFCPYVVSGYQSILGDPPSPAVYTLVYDSGNTSWPCFAGIINHMANQLLQRKAILLNGSKLATSGTFDHGILLEMITNRLSESDILVVSNLMDIPGHLAQVFHVLCDAYNPIYKDAIFIFAIEAEGKNSAVEEALARAWKKDLQPDDLYPLITRLTSLVIPVSGMKDRCPFQTTLDEFELL